MIVESPWKASIEPKDVSPASFVIPGGRASRPKTKRVPAVALPRSVTTTLFTKRKNIVPAGTTKKKKANRNCRPIPPRRAEGGKREGRNGRPGPPRPPCWLLPFPGEPAHAPHIRPRRASRPWLFGSRDGLGRSGAFCGPRLHSSLKTA